jgi:hypothetical protein
VKVAAVFALIALVVIPVYPHFVSPNELSRWVLTAAIVERQTLEVSEFADALGPRFEDLSELEGRTYSNKPPGLALLTIPGYVAARSFAGPYDLRPLLYCMRLVGSTLPLLLLAFTFMRVQRRLAPHTATEPAVFTLLFATPLFAYGLLLFSHALVAAALFTAWALLFPLRRGSGTDAGAGALLGLAVLAETAALFPAAVLFLSAFERKRPLRLLAVIGGGLPFAVLYALYNLLAFGGPFQLSHMHEKVDVFRRAAEEGFGWPSPRRAVALLLHPSKGLFVLSPVLLLALFRLREAGRALSRPALFSLCFAPLAAVLFASSYVNWHGGWGVGPRYIAGILPFLVLPLAITPASRLQNLLTGFSAFAVALASLVFPFVPEDFPLPWGSFALPLLARGVAAPNLFDLASVPFAFLIPIVLAAGAMVLAFERRDLAAALAGVALALLVGIGAAVTYGRQPLQRIQTGYIAEVYFEKEGALEAAADARGVPSGLLRRRAYEITLPPASWPFSR